MDTEEPKLHVILDIDNTLICAEATEEFPFKNNGIKEKVLNFPIHDMDGFYIIFERPFLQDFLNYLFKNFTVSIWTAASKDYALYIIKNIILSEPDRELNYIFFSYHCDISKKKFKSNQKDLRLLWNNFKNLDLGYTSENTIIIDDYDHVHNIQPCNCLKIYPFDIIKNNKFNDECISDSYLKEMIQKLEKYKEIKSTNENISCITKFIES